MNGIDDQDRILAEAQCRVAADRVRKFTSPVPPITLFVTASHDGRGSYAIVPYCINLSRQTCAVWIAVARNDEVRMIVVDMEVTHKDLQYVVEPAIFVKNCEEAQFHVGSRERQLRIALPDNRTIEMPVASVGAMAVAVEDKVTGVGSFVPVSELHIASDKR